MDQVFAKAPGEGSRTGWHNDLPYWPLKGWQVLTVWVSLDPITRENGALEFIRRLAQVEPPLSAVSSR